MNYLDRLKLQARKALASYPYFVFLLPLFFVFHGLNENFGFVKFRDGVELWLQYSVALLVFFGLFLLLFKQHVKAAILTFYLFVVFFFYGALQDFLASHASPLNRYSLWLPFLFIVFVLLMILLKRSKNTFSKLVTYLNFLFVLLIAIDSVGLLAKWIFPVKQTYGVNPPQDNAVNVQCLNCPKPDIYFVILDEYTSSAVLKNKLGYDNSDIDSFLVSKKFRLNPASSSNYNNTVFSMSSMLNMSYIHGINPRRITGKEYALCKKLLSRSAVIERFASMGYEITNLSFFDMEEAPAPIQEHFLPSKTELITGQTLLFRLHKHLFWHLVMGRFAIPALAKDDSTELYNNYRNNIRLLDSLKIASKATNSRPRFLYTHLVMPHSPFLFDKSGNFVPLDEYRKAGNSIEGYINNLRYTNNKLKELVTNIQENTKGKAVIMVMGDHGYRSESLPKHDYFRNFNSIYLPPGYQSAYYDSVSGVNQFRVLFNTLFKTGYPLLKDSTVFLADD